MLAVLKNDRVLILSGIDILKRAKTVRLVLLDSSTTVMFILVLHESFDVKA